MPSVGLLTEFWTWTGLRSEPSGTILMADFQCVGPLNITDPTNCIIYWPSSNSWRYPQKRNVISPGVQVRGVESNPQTSQLGGHSSSEARLFEFEMLCHLLTRSLRTTGLCTSVSLSVKWASLLWGLGEACEMLRTVPSVQYGPCQS